MSAETAVSAPSEPSVPDRPKAARLASIDALRGFDMFWIIGGENFVPAVAAFFGWSRLHEILLRNLEHAKWNGFTAPRDYRERTGGVFIRDGVLMSQVNSLDEYLRFQSLGAVGEWNWLRACIKRAVSRTNAGFPGARVARAPEWRGAAAEAWNRVRPQKERTRPSALPGKRDFISVPIANSPKRPGLSWAREPLLVHALRFVEGIKRWSLNP